MTMKTKIMATIAGALVTAAAWAVVTAGTRVRVGDGREDRTRAPRLVLEEGGESFNLTDLKDGETRTLGEGAKQVKVSRQGDTATIERPARGDERELSISCRLSSDTCEVVTFDNEPEKLLVVVQKERECINGEGDCETDVELTDGFTAGARVIIEKRVQCDEAGNCHETEDIRHGGLGSGPGIVRIKHLGKPGEVESIVTVAGDDASGIVSVEDGNSIALRCPEGDTTMRVPEEEGDRAYTCPRHNVPLEKVTARSRVLRMKMREPID